MRDRRELDRDRVAGGDVAAALDDRHDARAADQVAVGVAVEDRLLESGREGVELFAGIAEAGQLQHRARLVAQVEQRSERQREQVCLRAL